MHWNLMNEKEFGSLKFLELKCRTGDQITQIFCRIAPLPPEIRFFLFNLYKFIKHEKGTAQSSRMHWNIMNDEEITSLKLLKLKYRRETKISRIRFTKKSGHPSLICKNLRCVTVALLNHTERIETYWMMKNLGPSKFLN